ncbi:hypothetical protein COO60DRAFT_1157787 [Scenedesmus sp. NREL 46B-D3]|nr:hypothetical protein COO60DRAFT_1157787 [Scenedesmus sp. NREL 46B-D3]
MKAAACSTCARTVQHPQVNGNVRHNKKLQLCISELYAASNEPRRLTAAASSCIAACTAVGWMRCNQVLDGVLTKQCTPSHVSCAENTNETSNTTTTQHHTSTCLLLLALAATCGRLHTARAAARSVRNTSRRCSIQAAAAAAAAAAVAAGIQHACSCCLLLLFDGRATTSASTPQQRIRCASSASSVINRTLLTPRCRSMCAATAESLRSTGKLLLAPTC